MRMLLFFFYRRKIHIKLMKENEIILLRNSILIAPEEVSYFSRKTITQIKSSFLLHLLYTIYLKRRFFWVLAALIWNKTSSSDIKWFVVSALFFFFCVSPHLPRTYNHVCIDGVLKWKLIDLTLFSIFVSFHLTIFATYTQSFNLLNVFLS